MKKEIPVFHSEEEEARFWDTEDTTKYLDQFEPVECELDPELEEEILRRRELKKPVTLRLEPSQIEAVKKIAAKKGLAYQTLIRMWIAEAIERSKGIM